jgi:hypothetical protein
MTAVFNAKTSLEKDVDKPDVLPATRNSDDVSKAATEGLPPGAYDPKNNLKYQEGVAPVKKARRKEASTITVGFILPTVGVSQGVHGVDDGED